MEKENNIASINNIRLIPRHQIDDKKWDNLIQQSPYGLIYATTLWLDHMSPGWKGLVIGDYKYIMPLPQKKKFGITYLVQPALTQQLNIFSLFPIDNALIRLCLNILQKKYAYVRIHIGFQPDQHSSYSVKKNRNYILPINKDYHDIFNNYEYRLKYDLRKAEANQLSYHPAADTHTTLQSYFLQYKSSLAISQRHRQQFSRLVRILTGQHQCVGRIVRDKNGNLLCAGLFLLDDRRIYNIATITHKIGRKQRATHFLLDHIIREFAHTGIEYLDFEGSNLDGVAQFYKSFGPQETQYYSIQWNHHPLLRLFKS